MIADLWDQNSVQAFDNFFVTNSQRLIVKFIYFGIILSLSLDCLSCRFAAKRRDADPAREPGRDVDPGAAYLLRPARWLAGEVHDPA